MLLGAQQLQALQAQNLSSTKKADAPEQVKTGITAFPKLASKSSWWIVGVSGLVAADCRVDGGFFGFVSNARACAMLMDALDPVVKADLIARKANHSASHILFRLYATYQPGGTGERNLVLSNLQNPQVIHDATARVAALRDWGRWYQRCIDFGMNLPDLMVLVAALNSMTKPVISKDTEVTWRWKWLRAHCSCTPAQRQRQ